MRARSIRGADFAAILNARFAFAIDEILIMDSSRPDKRLKLQTSLTYAICAVCPFSSFPSVRQIRVENFNLYCELSEQRLSPRLANFD